MTRHYPPCPSCGGIEDIIGHEVGAIYDGILFWTHAQCGWAWPAPFEEGSYRWARARDWAEEAKTAMARDGGGAV